jgi:phosphate transport system permease protein
MIVGLSTLISTPIGILAGISRIRRRKQDRRNYPLRHRHHAVGAVDRDWHVRLGHVCGHHQALSGYAGSIALALIAVPVVVRTTDNMLRLVPNSLLEAAFALGAPRWKVAMMVRLRAVKAGVITGVLLAVARVSGETAPLLFTALNNQFFSSDMNAPMANLPVVIYGFA